MRRTSLKEKGITLVALVVTIIVLLILAGITINMAIDNNGLIQRAKDASEVYAQAENNETKQLSEFADSIDELTGKTGLSQDKITAVNKKIREAETLQKLQVAYEAKEVTDDETSVAGKGRSVTVEGEYSGTGTDQVFNQLDIGAIGSGGVGWYLLSADENGVNLVSGPTKMNVQFKDSPGYDNCLYYLNELSAKLFANEDLEITEDRIHAFRLTDVKKAAEQVNVGTEWTWEEDVMAKLKKDYNKASNTYTNIAYTYHPALYQVKEGTTDVEVNNSMYDELPGNIITDRGIKREETGNPASKLTVNNTASYDTSADSWKEKLGTFGNSKIAEELFHSPNKYWLASRSICGSGSYAYFRVRCVYRGYLTDSKMCDSYGYDSTDTNPFRVVISVPGNRVNIADNGTVTLKQANS